jgi:hypothetical protein
MGHVCEHCGGRGWTFDGGERRACYYCRGEGRRWYPPDERPLPGTLPRPVDPSKQRDR